MNRLVVILLACYWNVGFVYAQAPSKFNYQAVARNTAGNLIINQSISVRVSILTGSVSGTSEYQEIHAVITDGYGVFNILVGGGSVVSGSFAGITWGSASKFLKIEADVTGGTTYQAIATTQILSVPYALYAEKAGNSVWTDGSDHIYANNVTTTSSVAVSDKGFLGIGTKNPLGEIHVNKPIGYSGTAFTGSGLNDLTVNYTNFSGIGDINYIVEVWNTGPNPDLFRWSSNGGTTWTNDVPMQISGISLGDGLTIGFNAVDGHTYGARWQFTVSQGFMNGLIVKDGKVGIGNNSPTEALTINGKIKFIDGSIQEKAAEKTLKRIYNNTTQIGTSVNPLTTLLAYTIPANTATEEIQIMVRGQTSSGGGTANGSYGLMSLYVNGNKIDESPGRTYSTYAYADDVTFFRSYSASEIDFSSDIIIEIKGINIQTNGTTVTSGVTFKGLTIYAK
jgi:hypothetical protein